MPEKKLTLSHEAENAVYTIQGRTFIVTPVYTKEGGGKISETLLKLMCEDVKKKHEKP